MQRSGFPRSIAALLALAGVAHAQCDAPRLLSPTPGSDDNFGASVAIDGLTALVGSPFAASSEVADRGKVDVYSGVFGWLHQATLVPDNEQQEMWFGRAVAVSGDWAMVGAPMYRSWSGGEGAVYLFKRQGNQWVQKSRLGAGPDGIGNDHAGSSVAIDGDYAIYGMPDASPWSATWMGRARVLVRVGDAWNDVAFFYGPQYGVTGGNAGASVDVRGSHFLMGAPGASVAGLPGAGVVCVTQAKSGDYWYPDAELQAGDPQQGARLGESAALGNELIVAGAPDYDIGSVPDAGTVYIFTTDQFGVWHQSAQLLPPAATPQAHFGQKVRIEGTRIIVTEPGTGRVYSYRRGQLGTWLREWQLHDPYDLGEGFGFGVAISGGKVLVGSPLGEVQNLTSAGWAHIFDLDGGSGSDLSTFAPAVTIGTRAGCTTMATNDGDTTCGSSNSRPDVWYRFTAPCSGLFTFDTAGSDFDTVLSIHSSTLLSAGPTIACNDNVGGLLTYSRIQTTLLAGESYFIRISGNNQNGGAYTLNIAGCTACYANCDASTAVPILNVNDFTCFLNKYAAGDPYANCDGSTILPVLNVNDFVCFQTKFAAGCP
jgi:hypothetical protein